MDLEPVESGALSAPAPVRRRRPGRWVPAGVAVVMALGAIGVAVRGDDEGPGTLQTATAPDDGAAAPVDVTEGGPTSTTGATDTTGGADPTTSSTGVKTSLTTRRAAPTNTTVRPSTTTTTAAAKVSGPGRGTVLNVDRAGVWAIDLATGTLQRLADAAPFDVAGDFVLTAKGRNVFATPIGGGDTVLRYEAPSQGNPQFASGYTFDASRESVDWIDAGVDGSVVAGIFGPVVGPDGKDTARNGNYYLLSPSGQRVTTPYIHTSFAWSADGTKLAASSYATSPTSAPAPSMTPTSYTPPRGALVVLRPDGTVLHGPVDSPETQSLHGLAWAGDGRSVVWQNTSTGAVNRYDVGSGRFTVLPGKPQSVAIGLDGRVLTTRYVPENDTAVDFLDPVTGALTPFLPRGDYPSWSPDGKSVVVAVIPPPHYGNTPYPLAVVDAGGTTRFTVTIPDQLAFGQISSIQGPGYNRPQWSVSGRHLVFAAYPR